MIKTRTIKVKHIENEEIIMAVTMTKIIIITAVIISMIIIMMRMKIKIVNWIKILKR